jgi:hypothetical protein
VFGNLFSYSAIHFVFFFFWCVFVHVVTRKYLARKGLNFIDISPFTTVCAALQDMPCALECGLVMHEAFLKQGNTNFVTYAAADSDFKSGANPIFI